MSDEACPHYEDFINNMIKGHEFLLQEFGVKPKVAWHIDPFGHSNASPRLFAEMGFELGMIKRVPKVTKITQNGQDTTVESEGKEAVQISIQNHQVLEDAAAEFFKIIEGQFDDVTPVGETVSGPDSSPSL